MLLISLAVSLNWDICLTRSSNKEEIAALTVAWQLVRARWMFPEDEWGTGGWQAAPWLWLRLLGGASLPYSSSLENRPENTWACAVWLTLNSCKGRRSHAPGHSFRCCSTQRPTCTWKTLILGLPWPCWQCPEGLVYCKHHREGEFMAERKLPYFSRRKKNKRMLKPTENKLCF